MKLNIREESQIPVAWIKATGGPDTYPAAFQILEAKIPNLRGRRMYGVTETSAGEDYFAAVRLDEIQTDDMGFERGTIPDGLYAHDTFTGWQTNTDEIPRRFDALATVCKREGYERDKNRPSLEYYRSAEELVLLYPVLPKRGPTA